MKGMIMKKTFLVLAVLMLVVPVMAGITVTAKHVGSGVVEVNYVMTGSDDVNIPRAFALDVNLSAANGTAAPKDIAVVPTILDPNFYVSPGTFSYVGGVTNWGTGYAGSDVNGFTIEIGSLWATNDTNHPKQPTSFGKLFSFTVDKTCRITLKENAQRGGVVMESTAVTFPPGYVKLVDANVTSDVNCLYVGKVFLATVGSPLLVVNSTMMGKWNYLGRPNCWCCLSQKRGNGVYAGGSALRPDNSDLNAIRVATAWMKQYNQAGYVACSDVDLSGRLDNTDLNRVRQATNWMVSVGAGSGCW
jgi:hypothetical protein